MRARKEYLQQLLLLAAVSLVISRLVAIEAANHQTITGKAAFADYTQEKPGVFRKITVADLPQPFASKSVDNQPDVIERPQNAWPQTLPAFKVELYASGLDYPRLIRTAPNGDLFLAESRRGEIKVFRGVTSDGKAQQT